jgi:predicted phosphodiesterase
LPHTLVVELAGVRVGMIHDSGPWRGRAARLWRRFPDADVVVFGHSHAPVAEDGEGGQLLFNPGSPTQRRAQPVCTFGELYLAGGAVIGHRIIPVGDSGERPGRGRL